MRENQNSVWHRFLRVYLDLGKPMRQALLNSPPPDAAFSHVYISALLAAFEQEQNNYTQRAMTDSLDQQEQTSRPHPELVEPLSPQERRVLHLLVAGRSNPEIANALVVSVNTIKTPVQSIYRKLGVANRVEASAAARDLQIL